jgi:hypothetical protein
MAMIEIPRSAIEAAVAAGKTAPRFTGYGGCARVYVQISGGRINAASVKLLATFGLKVMPRAFGRPAIYIGYDNATGADYGKAIAMAKAFTQAGVSAYEDADED